MESGDFDELFINKPISISSEIVQFLKEMYFTLSATEEQLSVHRSRLNQRVFEITKTTLKTPILPKWKLI